MSITVAGRSYRVNEGGVVYSFIREPGEHSLRIPVYISDEVSVCGGRYLVYYDPVGTTMFCNWDRLVEGVELPPAESPEETPVWDPANIRVVLNTLSFL